MKGKSLSPQTQCKDMIPSVNDTEIRKQLSKMGRNNACELDNLLIEAIIIGVRADIHLGGQTEFHPNGEHNLFLSRGPAREKK